MRDYFAETFEQKPQEEPPRDYFAEHFEGAQAPQGSILDQLGATVGRAAIEGPAGVLHSMQNATAMLPKIAPLPAALHAIGNRPAAPVFDRAAQALQAQADQHYPENDFSRSVPGMVVSGAVQMPSAIAGIEAAGGGIPGMAISGALQAPPDDPAAQLRGAAIGGAQGAVMGAASKLPILPRVGIGGAAMAAPGVLEGRPAKENIAQGVLGAGLSVMPGQQEKFQAGSEGISSAVKDLGTQLNPPKPISESVAGDLTKAIRPSVGSQRTNSARQRYLGDAESAIRTLVENKHTTGVVDDLGQPKNPENLNEFSQAIAAGKKQIFENYDSMAKEAGESGKKVNVKQAVDQLRTVADSKVVKTWSPEVADYASESAKKLKASINMDPTELQSNIQYLNTKLEGFYRNPSYETASKAAVDAGMVRVLRSLADDFIENETGAKYQAERNKYKALKTIEADVNRRAVVDARKNPHGFFDVVSPFAGGDILSGVLSLANHGSPAGIVRGMSMEGLKQFLKYRNNPNTLVKSVFKNAEARMAYEKQGQGPNLIDQAKQAIGGAAQSIKNEAIKRNPMSQELKYVPQDRRAMAQASRQGGFQDIPSLQANRPATEPNAPLSYQPVTDLESLKKLALEKQAQNALPSDQRGGTVSPKAPAPEGAKQNLLDPLKNNRGAVGKNPTGDGKVVYHYSDKPIMEFKNIPGGTWFTSNEFSYNRRSKSGTQNKYSLPPGLKLATAQEASKLGMYGGDRVKFADNIKKAGFDGAKMTVDGDTHYLILYPAKKNLGAAQVLAPIAAASGAALLAAGNAQAMGNAPTKDDYNSVDEIRKFESFIPNAKNLGDSKYETVGYGHLLDNPKRDEELARMLEIKDIRNLNKEQAEDLFRADLQRKYADLQGDHPASDPKLLDVMSTISYGYSPAGFNKRFGKFIDANDTDGLKTAMQAEATRQIARGFPGWKKRFDAAIAQLDKIKE